jgi:hypothetical protein
MQHFNVPLWRPRKKLRKPLTARNAAGFNYGRDLRRGKRAFPDERGLVRRSLKEIRTARNADAIGMR